MQLLAYLDRWNVQPGDDVDVMVSGPTGRCRARLVRITSGGPRPEGTADAFAFDEIGQVHEADIDEQPIVTGSYLRVDAPVPLADRFTLTCSVWPTGPGRSRQGIWSCEDATSSMKLCLDGSGRLELAWSGPAGRGVVALSTPMLERQWYSVSAEFDRGTGYVGLTARCTSDWTRGGVVDEVDGEGRLPAMSAATLLLACSGTTPVEGSPRRRPVEVFNGKIGEFSIASGQDRLLAWDFSVGMSGDIVTDITGNGHSASLVGSPMRSVTGRSWDGSVLDPVLAPGQYDAVYFHDDDIDDMGWIPTFRLTVPVEGRSGLYAVRLVASGQESFVPIFVRPADHQVRSKIAVVLPTFTYLAYSNYVVGFDDIEFYTGEARDRDPADAYLRAHPELGLSLYNKHSDGSGIHLVSRLRPIPNHDPRHRFWISGGGWTVGGDLFLLDWLEQEGIDYDILTDDDLHNDGADLLAGYRIVLTGAHPEYSSASILDAYQGFVRRGGRIMYLGGNGFYWVVSPMPDRPHILEVRRGYAGTRAWQSLPGEMHHSGTGEPGGLWRHRGRAPQRIFGVGFAAQGGGEAAGFRRTPTTTRTLSSSRVCLLTRSSARSATTSEVQPAVRSTGWTAHSGRRRRRDSSRPRPACTRTSTRTRSRRTW